MLLLYSPKNRKQQKRMEKNINHLYIYKHELMQLILNDIVFKFFHIVMKIIDI